MSNACSASAGKPTPVQENTHEFCPDPGTAGRNPRRADGGGGRRRGPRERRRPDHGRRTGAPGRHQLHGHPRPWPGVPVADPRALRAAGPGADGAIQHRPVPHQFHRQHRGGRGRDHRHLGLRPCPHHPHRRASGCAAGRPEPARPHLPARRPARRGADPRRPYRGGQRPAAAGRAGAGRGAGGSDERRRQHGPASATGSVRPRARAEDGFDRRPDRLAVGHRAHGRAGGRARHRHRVRALHPGHLPRPHRPRAAFRPGPRHPGAGHPDPGPCAGGKSAQRPAALAARGFRRGRHRRPARDRRGRAGGDGGAVGAAQCRGAAGATAHRPG